MNESQPIVTPTDALVGKAPITDYGAGRFVGVIDNHPQYADSFVIMLAGSSSQAFQMMRDQFGPPGINDWCMVEWSRFVEWHIGKLIGFTRLYSVGNDETAWKRGPAIHTISELMEACK